MFYDVICFFYLTHFVPLFPFSSSLRQPFWILASFKIFPPNKLAKVNLAQPRKYFIYEREVIIYVFPVKRKNKSKTLLIWTAPKNAEESQRWLFTIFEFIMKVCNDQGWTLMNRSYHNPTAIEYWTVIFYEIFEPVEFCFFMHYF